ncbi:MAG: carbohydrate ABC transporter permease [Anaerolineaceae bacterium]|nr:carbohydrate ABC transporter permease [Anaerolineaceae bacterium]
MVETRSQQEINRVRKRPITIPTIIKWLRKLFAYVLLLITLGSMAFPLVWMVLSSFKTEREMLSFPPTFFPREWSLKAYQAVLQTDFLIWFKNSMTVSIAATITAVTVSAFGAYALSRSRNRGVQWFSKIVLFTYLIPTILLLIPIFRIVVNLQLSNSLGGLIVVYNSILLPYGLWTLRSYFAGIPHEIEEAARIDGATRFQAFYKVVLPQALPGLVSTALFAFNVCWNEYLFAVILIGSGKKWTLNPGIASLVGALSDQSWTVVMAASTLATVPVIILFSLLQRYWIAGWGGGAVKG